MTIGIVEYMQKCRRSFALSAACLPLYEWKYEENRVPSGATRLCYMVCDRRALVRGERSNFVRTFGPLVRVFRFLDTTVSNDFCWCLLTTFRAPPRVQRDFEKNRVPSGATHLCNMVCDYLYSQFYLCSILSASFRSFRVFSGLRRKMTNCGTR